MFPNDFCWIQPPDLKVQLNKKNQDQDQNVFRAVLRCIEEYYTSISPYSVRIRENTDQNNSEYGHFSHSKSSL